MAEMVVYTVNSRTSVRADGMEPVGAYASYSQSSVSGRVGQMTEGGSTSLSLYGFSGLRIRSVTLMMHSNKAAGAGTLEMNLNDSCVWFIDPAPFSDDSWHGSYSTSFVPVMHRFSPALTIADEQVISINIDALVSSLYVQSYAIEYDKIPSAPCHVSFSVADGQILPMLTETKAGTGIILPSCPAADSVWCFWGWLEQPLTSATEHCPSYYEQGARYFPSGDICLYALYADVEPDSQKQIVQDTTCSSGDYLIVDKLFRAMAVGGMNSNKRVPARRLDSLHKNQDSLYCLPLATVTPSAVYHIDFLPDSLATIYNVSEQTYISFPGTSTPTLVKTKKEWNYRRAEEGMLVFYHNYTSTSWRELRATTGSTLETIDSLWFENSISHSVSYANILFPAPPQDVLSPVCHYTTDPFSTSLKDLAYSDGIFIENREILNPQHCLLQIFSLQGILVDASSEEHISLATLPPGIYILRTKYQTHKMLIK
ncbi:MAG TPA: hypothetical protein DIW30_00500 [Bacteroidales bacterium]|nr:hypothetical protein [Bacteroidales bacterium]